MSRGYSFIAFSPTIGLLELLRGFGRQRFAILANELVSAIVGTPGYLNGRYVEPVTRIADTIVFVNSESSEFQS
jgi:hypothetical protein